MLDRFLRFPDGKPKAVTFSYDDGPVQDIRLSDLFTEYGLKCTFNLNSTQLKRIENISADDVKTHILDKGHEVAVHGAIHRSSGTHRPIEGIRDVLDCRLELEKTYGRIIRGMAYPNFGVTHFTEKTDYSQVKAYLENLEIAYSRSLKSNKNEFKLPQDWYNWEPTAHHNNKEIFEYIDEFLNLDLDNNIHPARRNPRLFFVWGHSNEFDFKNNWEHIEAICQKLSMKDNIWYATNIEIHDYVEAYFQLIYSADNDIIYNPTLIDIWLDIDSRLYCIKSGETLILS